jgi:hypothetical protein
LGAIESKDFCGNIIVRDWDGKFLRGYKYKNGKRIANFSDTVKSGRVALFVCGQIDWFSVSCGGGDCTTSYMYTETQYCSECCSGEETTVFPSNSDYNTSNNPNGQSGYTGVSMTTAQKNQMLDDLVNKLPEPVTPKCSQERVFYANNIALAIAQHYWTTKARELSDVYFCSTAPDNDNKNAFRHMMWNAIMGSTVGHNAAIMMSNLHECPGNGTDTQRMMDGWNNQVGATYGANNSNLSFNELGVQIFNLVKTGQGRRMDGDNLIPTSSEGECTNN